MAILLCVPHSVIPGPMDPPPAPAPIVNVDAETITAFYSPQTPRAAGARASS